MKGNNTYNNLFDEWCYVYDNYIATKTPPLEVATPLTVILGNCANKEGPILITNIQIDQKNKLVIVTTDNKGVITIDQSNQWRIIHGRTKSGKTIFTKNIE
jgi:hypothetical protein